MANIHPTLVFVLSTALVLSALVSPPVAAAGIDDSPSSSSTVDEESLSANRPKKKSTKDRASTASKLKELREERDRVMEELLALEEGYSKLAEDQAGPSAAESPEALEKQLQSRLTLLQTRLDTLDLEIAAIVRASDQR